MRREAMRSSQIASLAASESSRAKFTQFSQRSQRMHWAQARTSQSACPSTEQIGGLFMGADQGVPENRGLKNGCGRMRKPQMDGTRWRSKREAVRAGGRCPAECGHCSCPQRCTPVGCHVLDRRWPLCAAAVDQELCLVPGRSVGSPAACPRFPRTLMQESPSPSVTLPSEAASLAQV